MFLISARGAIGGTLIALLIFCTIRCATYMASTQKAQAAFYGNDYDQAAKLLEEEAKKDSKDQLLYVLDRAMALQLAGHYAESEKEFLVADKMVEIKDYTSLSEETASILINDNLKQYKGEDFEKVLINAFLAIDYTLDGKYEDARVECRRVNHKLLLYKTEAKRNYEQNPFARYLSAIIWEADGRLDDAYIDYKEAWKIEPDFLYLKDDLVKLAKRLGRTEDVKKWNKEFGDVEVSSAKDEAKTGEIILIYQQGKSATKRPHPNWPRLPKFYPRFSETQQVRVEVSDVGKSETAQKIYSVSDTAIKTLDDAYAGLVAKGILSYAAKDILADQVRQKNELLGFVAWVGLHATDQADLRYWTTLPDTIQIARLRVPPGSHSVKVTGLNASNSPTGEEKTFQVDVAAGKKTFINWRSIR